MHALCISSEIPIPSLEEQSAWVHTQQYLYVTSHILFKNMLFVKVKVEYVTLGMGHDNI